MNQAVVNAKFFQMVAPRWAGGLNGVGVDFDGSFGFQCMDLAEEWARRLGLPRIGGNAIDLPANGPKKGWHWVPNGPRNFPPRGALVVWGFGKYGHVGVAGAANWNTLNAFQQNNPIGTVCHMINNMSYHLCKGWLVPN